MASGVPSSASYQNAWPRHLIWLGIAAGTIVAVGVLAIPKVFISYISLWHRLVLELGELTGYIDWRFLYPAWVMWLGGVSQKNQYARLALQDSGSMLYNQADVHSSHHA